MRLKCLTACTRFGDLSDIKESMRIYLQRISSSSDMNVFDFFSAGQFCAMLSSCKDSDDIRKVTQDAISLITAFGIELLRGSRTGTYPASIHIFDIFTCLLLQDDCLRTLPDGLYMRFIDDFGNQVLASLFADSSVLHSVKRNNCESLLSDCFHGWTLCIDPRIMDHVLESSEGWSRINKLIRQRDPGSNSHGNIVADGISALFDFGPVVMRTSIYGASVKRSDERVISRVHVSFFRYLISRKVFASHVLSIVRKHNQELSESSDCGNTNESNVTCLNNTPGRRGSVDSMASYQSAEYATKPLNNYMEMFSVHCLNFFGSFGTGLLVQVSNDLLTALNNPPSDFLGLMLTLSPSQASSEGHAAVKRYLSSQLLASLQNLVRNRSDRTVAEDGCLSFLMKAEMSALSHRRRGIVQDYRVVSAMVDSVLRLTISDRIESTSRKSIFRLPTNSRIRKDVRFIEWLQYLSSPAGHRSPLVEAMIHSPEGRKELRSIYREIAAADVSTTNFWESAYAAKVNACHRMVKSDFRLLMTTANGLGVTPVPIGSDELSVSRSVSPVLKKAVDQQRSPVPSSEPSLDVTPPADYREPQEVSLPPLPIGRPVVDVSPCMATTDSSPLDELRQRISIIESVQTAMLSEIETLKVEMQKRRSSSKSNKGSPEIVPRDDPIATVDEKIEAVFKRLAEGS